MGAIDITSNGERKRGSTMVVNTSPGERGANCRLRHERQARHPRGEPQVVVVAVAAVAAAAEA